MGNPAEETYRRLNGQTIPRSLSVSILGHENFSVRSSVSFPRSAALTPPKHLRGNGTAAYPKHPGRRQAGIRPQPGRLSGNEKWAQGKWGEEWRQRNGRLAFHPHPHSFASIPLP